MKKSFRLILIGILSWLSLIAILIAIFFNSYSKINFIPMEDVPSNIKSNITSVFDYGYGKFAYLDRKIFLNELAIIDSTGNCKYFSGIGDKFKIYKDKIIFIKNDKLWSKDIDTGTTIFLSDNTRDFIVYNNKVIYQKLDPYTYIADLYLCDLNGGNQRILCKHIDNYCINGDSLYIITANADPRLILISLTDFSYEEVMPFGYGFVNSMMVCGNNLLFYSNYDLKLLDLTTLKINDLKIDDFIRGNKIDFVCDENSIYLTFQYVRYNGSLVSDVESEDNGLWKINLETCEKEKILSDVFWDLYLAGNGQLFGTLDGVPYLIDTETKQIQKIID